MKRKLIQHNEAITIPLSEQDRQLIRDHTFADDEYTDRLIPAPEGAGLIGAFTLDELDDLLGHIAAQSNHTDDTRLQAQLDKLYDLLQAVEQSHVEAD